MYSFKMNLKVEKFCINDWNVFISVCLSICPRKVFKIYLSKRKVGPNFMSMVKVPTIYLKIKYITTHFKWQTDLQIHVYIKIYRVASLLNMNRSKVWADYRYMITWMLHHSLCYSNKMLLQAGYYRDTPIRPYYPISSPPTVGKRLPIN